MDSVQLREKDISHGISKHTVEVYCEDIESPLWIERVKGFVEKVLNYQNYSTWTVSIVFCSNRFIRNLNRKYCFKDMPTDVLSFAQIDSPASVPQGNFYAGDVVISLDTLAENALYFKVAKEEELKRLLVHGILHLGGWNHSDNSPDQEMLIRQEHIVDALSQEKIY